MFTHLFWSFPWAEISVSATTDNDCAERGVVVKLSDSGWDGVIGDSMEINVLSSLDDSKLLEEKIVGIVVSANII